MTDKEKLESFKKGLDVTEKEIQLNTEYLEKYGEYPRLANPELMAKLKDNAVYFREEIARLEKQIAESGNGFEQERGLINIALLDLWKANAPEPLEEEIINKALNDWDTGDLMALLDNMSDYSDTFHISQDRGGKWHIEHKEHEVKEPELKKALFKMMQHHIIEGKVKAEYLKGIDQKYLDFYSPNYGEEEQ